MNVRYDMLVTSRMLLINKCIYGSGKFLLNTV